MALTLSGDGAVGPLSATEVGYLDGVTSAVQTQINSKLNLAGGKILQVVRATDATNRSVTSSTVVDSGASVTITPQKSDSGILLIASFLAITGGTGIDMTGRLLITDNSNNSLSGTHINGVFGTDEDVYMPIVIFAYATPATTSAVTYKLRFASAGSNTTLSLNGNSVTGQMYAIEVSA